MMAAEFARHGVTHEFITLRNRQHGFCGAAGHSSSRRTVAVAFVKKHLGIR